MGPFQLIPYIPEESAANFTDQQNSTRKLTNCSLQNALVKFPDKVTEIEQKWLNESYVDLQVSGLRNVNFKVKV